jgi:hypothetical protein
MTAEPQPPGVYPGVPFDDIDQSGIYGLGHQARRRRANPCNSHMILAPGVYPGMPFDEYLGFENISKHLLDALARSPAHYRAALEQPRKRTAAMAFGAAVHTAILEPDQFARWYANALDLDKRTKAGRAAHEAAAAEGVTLLKPDEWDAIQTMTAAVRTHPFASILLNLPDGQAEISIAWQDTDTGAYCKARPDFLNEAHGGLCVDLKTATDASMGSFARACVNYNYHWQSAMYLDGLAAVMKPYGNFVFVVAEPEPPWAVACYELAPDDVALGRTLYRRALRVYQQCMETGVWNGYPQEVRILELPQWARFVPIA